MKRVFRNAGFYLLAFLIPTLIALTVFCVLGMAPFGDGFISGWDLYTQYPEYYSWFRRVLTGDGNLFYSFGKSLGGNTFSLFAYYLASPLNLLLLAFPAEGTLDFMGTICILKIGFCGLTAACYLKNRFDIKPVFVLVLSLGYALCEAAVATSLNTIMWMEVFALLPLLLLGIYRYVTDKKKALFLVAAVATVVTCWFVAYMAFLFAILYFVYEYYLQNFRKGFKHFVIELVKFGIWMLVALLISMPLLLPVIYAQLAGISGTFDVSLDLEYGPYKIGRSLFAGTLNVFTVPELFCGTYVTVTSIFFFCCKQIDKRARKAAALFLAFMLLCTLSTTLTEVWDGFRYAHGYYCRFSFLICFLMIIISAQATEKLCTDPSTRSWRMVIPLAILIPLAVMVYCQGFFLDTRFFLLAILMVVTVSLLMFLLPRSKHPVAIGIVLLVLAIAELGLNYGAWLNKLYVPAEDAAAYYEGYRTTEQAKLDDIQASDSSFFRMEKTYSRLETLNHGAPPTSEGMATGYNQLENYSSNNDAALASFIEHMGYSKDDMGATDYREPIIPSDSLLGIKYVCTNSGQVLTNQYALPIGFAASDEVLQPLPDTDESDIDIDPNNPFIEQNLVFSEILGKDTTIYEPLSSTKTVSSDTREEWTADVPDGSLAYGYFSTSGFARSYLYVGDDFKSEYNLWRCYYIFDISDLGDKTIKLTSDSDGLPIGTQELEAYSVNMDAFNSAIDTLKAKGFYPDEIRDGYVAGNYESDSDGLLLTTIPYDEGWDIRVNGVEVKPQKALSTFCAIPVQAGSNNITMTYTPQGFRLGIAIAIVTLFALATFEFVRRRKVDVAKDS